MSMYESLELLPTIPFIGLYAETHFKFFRWFPSLIFRKTPEIIFDMPRRIVRGLDIPVILGINDIDKYPIDILEIRIIARQNGAVADSINLSDILPFEIDHPFKKQSHWYQFSLDEKKIKDGVFYVTTQLSYLQNNKKHTVINDNLPTSSKQSMESFISSVSFPGSNKAWLGDIHTHSQFSQSHVEFGPPISIIDTISHSLGLDFVAITDHSYDLACKLDNYLVPDINQNRWKIFNRRINSYTAKTVLIAGEEISTTNKFGEVIHLGAISIKKFIPGSRDGARKQPNVDKEPNVSQSIEQIRKQGGLSFAAHPTAGGGILQKIFLKRGRWRKNDFTTMPDAFQALNSGFGKEWYNSRRLWIDLLLSKKKLPIIGGNDAHGDFNRYRAIKTPFISVSDNTNRYFGFGKTGIYKSIPNELINIKRIIEHIKRGKTFVTTGPFIDILNSKNESLISNSTILKPLEKVYVYAESSVEFGSIDIIRIFRGYYNTKKEKCIISHISNKETFIQKILVNFDHENGEGYIRAEVICNIIDYKKAAMAVSSPVYL